MSGLVAEIVFPMDPCNPGQFFACCGLLELANRRWGQAEGRFDGGVFLITAPAADATNLLTSLAMCELVNAMTGEQWRRLEGLRGIKKKDKPENLKAEQGELEALVREAPLCLGGPFHLRIDWWHDDRSGGARFKTWAGQQSVFQIASAMKQPLDGWHGAPPSEWFTRTGGQGLPFNFDAALGAQSSAVDVGFSPDPLNMSTKCRPLLELAAFIGLQRFRPATMAAPNRFSYSLWNIPLLPEVAALATLGQMGGFSQRTFEFSLLYRTTYLKSFLPATPRRGDA